jgi:RNA polymerase sigma-70 factor (ECF subfamily)
MTEGTALADADASPAHEPPAAPPEVRRDDSRTTESREHYRDNLATSFSRGDPDAFDEVVRRFQPQVSRLANRLLGWRSRAEVEDVVQEVFLAALTHCRRFRGQASLATWLTAITLNKCRSHQRRWRVALRLFVRNRRDDGSDAPAPPPPDAPALAETSAAVRGAVQSLPPKDREVIVLRYFENLSAPEIATLTGASRSAVEVRLHRARARLADLLRPLANEERS